MGIVPYQRAKRDPVRPDRELESALRSLALLADDYPGFLDHLRQGGPVERGSRSYFRLDAPFKASKSSRSAAKCVSHSPSEVTAL